MAMIVRLEDAVGTPRYRRRNRCGWWMVAVWLVVVASVFAQQPTAGSPADKSVAEDSAKTAAPVIPPWEYSPYQVRVWIAAAEAPDLPPPVLADIQRELLLRADFTVGASWDLTVESPPHAIASTIAYAPESLTIAEISKAQREVLHGDKLIWVALQSNPREVRVLARELDCHTRTWGQMIVRSVRQPAALCQSVFDAALTVFRPLARIEDGDGGTCTIRARAGGLALSEQSPTWIGKGDALQPIFRQNDRYGEPLPNRIQAIPFTFLQVTEQDPLSPSLFQCIVHSSMRGPIRGRPTSRRERWALKVLPTLAATELIIESRPIVRNEPKTRLAGLEVYAKTPLIGVPKAESDEAKQAAEKKNPPELMGVTDWRGALSIPNQGQGLRILYIKNGGLLLARLPIIAGLDERLLAEVPDDDPRLQAEGFVKGMNGEITDLVVQRQLVRVRVRKKIAERKFDDAQKILDEFRDLKTMHDLQRTLDQQITRQKPTSNPAVRQRIEKLYAEEREMIAKYVDVDILTQLTTELNTARAAPPPPEEKEGVIDVTKPPPEKKDEAKKELPAALQKKE